MSSVKVKNVDKVFKSIDDRLRNTLSGDDFVRAAQKRLAEDNKKSVRLGKNPATMKSLAYFGDDDARNKFRSYIAKYNRTGKFYQLTRKNLTLTGQLVESIIAVITREGVNPVLRMDVKDKRKAYKGKTKKLKNVGNKKIVEELLKSGIRVLGINDATRKQILLLAKQFLRRKLR